MDAQEAVHLKPASLSARRAWIEIPFLFVLFLRRAVALRKESVDRNAAMEKKYPLYWVALRKESVDRNSAGHPAHGLPSIVALRKESVDRNWNP